MIKIIILAYSIKVNSNESKNISDFKVLLVEPTVQLKASLRRIIASSFFSRAQELLKAPAWTLNNATAHSHAPQQAPTLKRTVAEITTKCKAFKSKSKFNINMLLQ